MYLRLTFINAGNRTNEIVKLRKYSEHVMVFSDLILVVYSPQTLHRGNN